MHPDDSRLQRLLHEQLEPPEAARVSDHVAECLDCQRRFAEQASTDELIDGALSALDATPPSVTICDIRRRASQTARPRRPWIRAAAAGIVGIAFAGAAYAAPGSPLPSLLMRVTGRAIPEIEPARAPTSAPYGIAVSHQGGLTISITATGPETELTVRLNDADREVSVRSTSERIVYESDPGRLSVTTFEAGTQVAVVVPSSAPLVRIVTDKESIWEKVDDLVRTAAAVDSSGAYRLMIEGVSDPDSTR